MTDWTSAQLLELLSEELDARDDRISELETENQLLRDDRSSRYAETKRRISELEAALEASEHFRDVEGKQLHELEQQVAEYEARDSRYWHSIQKRTDGQAQRIRELEDAILNHLVENGYQDSEETLNWWVEQHQPCDVRTTKLEALEAAPKLNTASPETVRAIKCVTGQNND